MKSDNKNHFPLLLLIGALLMNGCISSQQSTPGPQPKAVALEPQAKQVQPAPQAKHTSIVKIPTASPPIQATRSTAVTPPTAATVPAIANRYTPQAQLKGYLRSIGSDSMNTTMELWEASFGTYQPKLRFRHEGKGPSTAMPAMLEQRSDFGPMSRALKPNEIESFQTRFGYAPTQLPVAIDTLAVYIHPDNPILQSGITLEQLRRIFAQADSLNNTTPITRWGQLGLTADWTNAPIRIHGRNPASGTHSFFQKKALNKIPFTDKLEEYAGSEGVVEAVSNDPYAIGYSGIAYITPEVRALPLKKGTTLVDANQANAASGAYPLPRQLYLTTNIDPAKGPSPLQREFLRFTFSQQGQKIVVESGYFRLATNDALKTFKQLR